MIFMKNSLFSLREKDFLHNNRHVTTRNEPRDIGIKNNFDLEPSEAISCNQSALNLLVSNLKTLYSHIKVKNCKKYPLQNGSYLKGPMTEYFFFAQFVN